MPEVSYIRHDDEGRETSRTKLGKKYITPKQRQQQQQTEQQRDEFDREDGLLAYALALYNLLITCSWVLVVGNVTGWHAMTFLGILSVSIHFVLSELLMKGTRKLRPALVYPWVLFAAVEEIALLCLGVGYISGRLQGVSFVQGFYNIGAFFAVSVTLTGVRYFLAFKVVHSCYRTQYQKF